MTAKGELVKVDADAKTITIKGADGVETEFAYTATTEVKGGRDGVAGLATKSGSKVTVHFTTRHGQEDRDEDRGLGRQEDVVAPTVPAGTDCVGRAEARSHSVVRAPFPRADDVSVAPHPLTHRRRSRRSAASRHPLPL